MCRPRVFLALVIAVCLFAWAQAQHGQVLAQTGATAPPAATAPAPSTSSAPERPGLFQIIFSGGWSGANGSCTSQDHDPALTTLIGSTTKPALRVYAGIPMSMDPDDVPFNAKVNVTGLTFSPDGRRLFTAGQDNTIKVWDTASGKELLTLSSPGGPWPRLAMSPDGHRLASADIQGHLKLWDATPWEAKPSRRADGEAPRDEK